MLPGDELPAYVLPGYDVAFTVGKDDDGIGVTVGDPATDDCADH